MLLAVDAGNTNTVFAVFEGGGDGGEAPLGQWRAMTDARRTSDEYAVWLGQLLAQAGAAVGDVQLAGDVPGRGIVGLQIGVQQVQRHPAHQHPPHLGVRQFLAQLHRHRQR